MMESLMRDGEEEPDIPESSDGGGPTAWSLSVPPGPARTFGTRASETPVRLTAPSREGREQIAMAIEAAIVLVTVIQPDGDGLVAAELSGFANPNHTRGAAGTFDGVTVKVRQV